MTMTTDEVLDEFRAAQALLEGHFVLASGLHSPVFLQKALIFKDPRRTERLMKALAVRVAEDLPATPEIIVAPAVGAIVPGYELARQMGLESLFAERGEDGFVLKRGFSLAPGQKVLLVEDVLTTGLSSRECLETIRAAGGDPVGAACLVDRSGGRADIGVPLVALATVDFPAYDPDNLPPALAAIPAEKPGTRQAMKG